MEQRKHNPLDKAAIDDITHRFFSLFSNTNGTTPKLDDIHDICVPEAIITKNTESQPEIYDLQQFIAPRKVILTDGTLTNFSEYETGERTDIFGKIAQRFCSYQKSGEMDGVPFEIQGMKTMQYIKTNSGWKITSVAWDDE